MRERLAGKIEEHNIAYKSVKKDGSLIYVEVYGMRTEFDGKPAVMGTLFDVTRRKKAEEALLESEGKFRSITETAVDYIFIKDEARKYTFVNKAMMDLIGLPENEILGKTPEEVFGAGEGCIIRKVDDRSFAGETVNETRTLTIGGNKRSFNTIQTPLTTAEGKVTSIMGIVRDVTEHKIAEDKLRSSEEISRNLIENSPDIITIHDLDGKLISVNHVVKGYKKEDVIGMYASDFVPMEYKQAHDKAFMNAAEENSPGTVEFSDSMNNHFLCRYFPFQQIHGAKSVMGITTDITERKMAEETLQQEHDMFMHGPTVVLKWLAEDNWPVDYVSSNIRKMLGYEPEDLTSGRVQYVNCIHPEDISRIEMEIGEYVESGINYYEQEYRLAGADGKYHWLHDSTTVVRDTSGKVKHFRGYILDITERKRAEEALLKSEKRFREAIAELIGAIEEQVLAQNFYTIESWKKSGMLETAKSALKDNAKKELDVDVTSTF